MTTVRARATVRSLTAALLFPVLLLLGGCTITFVGPGDGIVAAPAPVIERFEVRGSDEVRVGQQIAFQIRTRIDGYVTLTSLEPNGEVYVFARNIPVVGGRTVVLDGRSQGGVFVVEPGSQRGWHRVRASFTSAPTDPGRVRFVGRVGESEWYGAIRIDIEPFDLSDVAEARFYVR